LAHSWRQQRKLRESYVTASQKVEQDYKLSTLAFDAKKIVAIDIPGCRAGFVAAP